MEEPPKLTKGSGIPVTGASPIVMPTLTKIWNRRTKASAPATVAVKASRAAATIFTARQITSR